MSDSYKLRGDDLDKWVSQSDTHSDAPVEKGPSADEEVSQGRPTSKKPEGVSD